MKPYEESCATNPMRYQDRYCDTVYDPEVVYRGAITDIFVDTGIPSSMKRTIVLALYGSHFAKG